jgi:hypothetical protein
MDRRELLRLLFMIPWAAASSCHSEDWFKQEKICVHVYKPSLFLPKSLYEISGNPARQRERGLLTTGLPELLVCRMSRDPLAMFPYFWPLTRTELRALQSHIDIQWSLELLETSADVARLQYELRPRGLPSQSSEMHLVVLFTMNRYTSYWASAVAAASRDGGADELVVFKDSTVPPYLCDYPTLQKGFKRPPP